MSLEEYFLAFEAILYGLIVSRILVKWSEMASHKFDKIPWVYLILTLNVFLLIVNIFWANRISEHYEGLNSPLSFLLVAVLPPGIFTFMTYQMFPSKFQKIDLRNFLLNHRRNIFIPWTLYLLIEVFQLSVISINLISISTSLLLVITFLIVSSRKIVWINLFILIHSLLMIYAYSRAYLF